MSDTHIYYDISIFNNDSKGTMPVQLKFSEMRSGGALIDNPSDYLFSIVRFELDSTSLPLFIPQVVSGTVNTLIYAFAIETLDTGGSPVNVYKMNVQYVPANLNIPPPDTSQNNYSHEYYWVYTFNRWIDMVNKTLATLFGSIPTTELNGQPPTKAPFFQCNGSLITLYTTTDFQVRNMVGNTCSGKRFNMYWNAPTETVFGGMDTTQISQAECRRLDGIVDTLEEAEVYFKVNVNNYYNANTTQLKINDTTTITYIAMTQCFPSFPMCSPVQNIVFTTSGNLPVSSAQTANPVIFTSTGVCGLQGGAANITPILTDFIVPLTLGSEYKPKINYAATLYRMLDMKGNQPLRNIDLQVYWKSKVDAQLHPFMLGCQCGASCKILFRKKELGY